MDSGDVEGTSTPPGPQVDESLFTMQITGDQTLIKLEETNEMILMMYDMKDSKVTTTNV